MRLVKPYPLLLFSIVLQGGAVGLLAIAQAWLLSQVITGVFLGGAQPTELAGAMVFLLLLALGRSLLAWSIEESAGALAQRLKSSLRRSILERLLAAGPFSTRRFNAAELTNTLTNGLDALEPYYSQYLPQLFLAMLVPVSVLVVVAGQDLLSALIMLLTGPLIPLFMSLIGSLAERATKRQWMLLNRMSAYFLDVIQGLTTLKLLGRSRQQAEQIAQVSEHFRLVTLEVLRITFLSALALELLSTLSTAVVAVQVGLRLLAGQMSFNTALFMLILAPEFYLPLRLLGQRFHAAMSGAAAGEQVLGLLDSLPIAPSAVGSSAVTPSWTLPPSIHFESVGFTYDHDSPVLDNLSFELPAGSLTALVGPSGAGKSTIAGLLLGFIRPSQGKIMINGCNQVVLDSLAWRQQVAWLPQVPYLLNDSVAANLRMARPDATFEQLRQAARLAQADAFIQTLPEGYETQIGEHGLRLSAGQAQRLALSRTLLKNAPLIILDEPAAHLDVATEQAFQLTLLKLKRTHTVLLIAHRLSLAALADHVLVLDQGRLVQHGRPQTLSAQAGLYYDLLQAANRSPASEDLGVTPRSQNEYQPLTADDQRLGTPVTRDSVRRSAVRPLAWLLQQLIPFWRQVGLSTLLGSGVIASSVGLMATSAYLISAAALQPSIADLQVAIVGVRFFGLARGVLRYLERLASHDVAFRLLGQLRVWFYRALEPLAPARLLYRKSGDLLSRITIDLASLETFYVRSAAPLFVAMLSLAGLLIFFTPFGPGLAAALVGVFLLAGLPVPWLLQRLGEAVGNKLVLARARLNAALVELFQGMPDLLAFDHPQALLARLELQARDYARLQLRMTSLGGLQSALSSAMAHLGMWVVLFLGIQQVWTGALPGIYLAALALAAQSCFEAVQPLAQAAQQAGAHRQSAGRLLQIASQGSAVLDPPSPRPPPQEFSLHIHSLNFSYPGEVRPVLHDVSFDLLPGQQVAIVGPSGAGKSTLLHLLLRFWDYTSGEILLDGHDLRQYHPEDLHRRMAVVSQHTYLFNATLEQNLLLANPQATPEQLEWALHQAQLQDFVQSLPEGSATWLGEHGLRLSAGQRQRVAIARALLRDAPLLLLDEPTAALDALNGQAILDTLRLLRQGRATLLVTHRLAGLEDFDQILVLQGGQISERGNHAELVNARGWYAQMWRRQPLSSA